MKHIIEKTFEEMYFGEDTLFLEYVEQYFLDNVSKNNTGKIENHLDEFYKWIETLNKDTIRNLIIVFKKNI